MNTYIALLRGVNVGGARSLPMKELAAVLEELGAAHVRTYIQSGNAVFQHAAVDSDELARHISAAIETRAGFAPHVFVMTSGDLETAIASNPFSYATAEPKTLHVYFLDSAPPAPDLTSLEDIRTDNEEFKLVENLLYLYAPDGIGRSKLAAAVEKALGVPATARNWRTVEKVAELASGVD